MPEHGHEVCPHCESRLDGAEATCPDCSGPLFGIAPNPSAEEGAAGNSGITTIDNVSVPTYTPPATDELGTSTSDESPESLSDEPHELTAEDLVQSLRGESVVR